MNKTELVKLAREFNTVHGVMPVPVAGKVPLGGTGWNRQSLEIRMRNMLAPECTGFGLQMGLVFHPVLGPIEVRCIDCDIDNPKQLSMFANHLRTFFPIHHCRMGRRPAILVFTQPGIIKREKFGPVQLLGEGKQVVWHGEYHNKLPLPNDPPEYYHLGTGPLDLMPPCVLAATLQQAIEEGVTTAGYLLHNKSMLSEAVPLTTSELAMLTPEYLAQLRNEIALAFKDVDNTPVGAGRGTKLHKIGITYGALIKASGTAPIVCDAMYEAGGIVVDYEVIDNPVLAEIGCMADQAFTGLRGTLGAGDQRDFARGVGASMGLSQTVAVQKAKHPLVMPTGRDAPGQTAEDLMAEDLPPLRFLVPRFFTDSGCILFAGKPKIGKGWIILDLAMSIAEGGKFWGEQCEQAGVLMYMLEDSNRRIKQRMRILRPNGFMSGKNMRFRYSINGPFYVNFDGTGTLLDDIKKHKFDFPHIRMVVVDVLQRIRGDEKRTDNAYQMDYKCIGAIQKLATELNVLIVVVHHTKKGKVDDAIDSISGSFGASGAADGAIIIGKEGDVVKVESRMRDIEEFEFEMIKESGSPMWKPAITATEMFQPNEGTKTQSVVMVLHAAACCLTAGDISVRTGISEKNVAVYLGRLIKNNQVTRPSRGFYMATNLKYRERIQGVIDVLKRCPKEPATDEIKARYSPNGVAPEATYMILTAVAIKEIEAGFVNGKDALTALKHRGLLTFNSDTVWLLGDSWEERRQQQMQPTPFTMRMPWENT